MKHSLLLFLLTLSLQSFSQDYFTYDQLKVINEFGDTINNPFAGGFNAPQFSEIDLDYDGTNDLFVYDRDGGVIKTFMNGGAPNQVDYTYSNQYWDKFPNLRNFALLIDYNCDGKQDIFTGATGGMAVYKNTGSASTGLQFELVTSLVMSDYGGSGGLLNLYVPSTDIPALCDVDNDGDIDVLTFGVWGSMVEYHENKSIDNYGTCDSLEFVANTTCWGNFSENSQNNSVTLGTTCKGIAGHDPDSIYSGVHSGSTILAIDMDGDGDKELALGDVSFPNMVYLINGGDSLSANITAQDTAFPPNTNSVNVNIFPAGYYLDVDNDGIKDLIVAPNAANISENFSSVWLYKNNGVNNSPIFNFVQDDFLQNDMIEVGQGANAVFEDVNQDGLLDLIVGNYGYYGNPNFSSKLAYFENVGTSNQPTFQLINRDYGGFSNIGDNGLFPAFGDLNGDGANDLLLGNYNGDLYLYENTANAGNPYTFSLLSANYMSIDIGQHSTPQIIDFNGDGLLDLLIGEREGIINYFENKGTPSAPLFSSTPQTNSLGQIDVMIPCCTGYSNVHLTRDENNELILYVGSEDGIVYIYSDIDTLVPDTSFTLIDSIVTGSKSVSVFTADINNSGKKEIVIGENSGGLSILEFKAEITLITPTDGANGVPYDIILDWTASPEIATVYEYQLDTTNLFNSTELVSGQRNYSSAIDDAPDSEVLIPSLTLGETYFWKVRYLTTIDTSDWTETWQFTVTEDSVTIADFEANETVVDTGTIINFTDLSSSNPASWEWTFSNGTPATSTAQNPQILYSTAGVFDVTLIVTNAFGVDTITKSGYITVQVPPNSIEESDNNYEVFIFPNPANEIITIQFSTPQSGLLSVIDINGRTVCSPQLITTQNTEFQISDLSSGVYFIRYENEEQRTFYKFIKL